MEYFYILLFPLIVAIPAIASSNINRTYKKYKEVKNEKNLSGFEVARKILDDHDLDKMYIVTVPGNLTDHYDPTQKAVKLSTDIFDGESVASMAVAAHECGHAIQDKEGYAFLKFRSALVPVVNAVSKAAYVMYALSLMLQMGDLLMIAIVSILFGLAFQIVTLPVEFDASRRGLKYLKELDIPTKDELEGAEKVLKAAAFTYVAAVLSSLLDLFQVVIRYMIRQDNRRR